jgi:hypothetical protein
MGVVHCPICSHCNECEHVLAWWDDNDGYSGPAFPSVQGLDQHVWDLPADSLARDFPGLSAYWDLLKELAEADLDSNSSDAMFIAAANRLGLDVDQVHWEVSSHPGGDFGDVYFCEDVPQARSLLANEATRIELDLQRLAGPWTDKPSCSAPG